MNCPTCGGETYDNRPRKADGRMKPNAPDFACKDKANCGWKQWPPKGVTRPAGNGAPASRPNGATPAYTWSALGQTFKRCYQIAGKVVGESSPDLHAATATLFIQATRMGLTVEPPPPPPPPPPIRAPVESDIWDDDPRGDDSEHGY